jgi:hypothetical protein
VVSDAVLLRLRLRPRGEPTPHSAHTSFIEIIKQLSPLDANNLIYLSKNTNLGVGAVELTTKDDTGSVLWKRHFFPFPDLTFENGDQYISSIDYEACSFENGFFLFRGKGE